MTKLQAPLGAAVYGFARRRPDTNRSSFRHRVQAGLPWPAFFLAVSRRRGKPRLYANFMASQRTALITGASFGIGHELAGIFAREGYNLVLVARSADKLRQLASELEKAHGTRSLILASDLAAPGAAAYVHDQTTRAELSVDVLVNNAGFGQFGLFVENDLEECLQQIQLNITTLTHLTRLYLPEMVERKSGRILNVASTAAFQAGPLMSVYYATKASRKGLRMNFRGQA